jgi:hypothetical protein
MMLPLVHIDVIFHSPHYLLPHYRSSPIRHPSVPHANQQEFLKANSVNGREKKRSSLIHAYFQFLFVFSSKIVGISKTYLFAQCIYFYGIPRQFQVFLFLYYFLIVFIIQKLKEKRNIYICFFFIYCQKKLKTFLYGMLYKRVKGSCVIIN